MQIDIAPGYLVEYFPSFYAASEADKLLQDLLAVDMTQEVTLIMGREVTTKRRSAQYGRDYDYNPRAKKAEPWTPLMLEIRARMEAIAGPLVGGLVQMYPRARLASDGMKTRASRK